MDRWNDDRLDELNRRLVNVENVNTTVTEIKVEQRAMRAGLDRANDGIGKLADKIGQVVDEPLVRARDFRRQLLLGLAAAAAGGVCVLIATLIAGAVK